MAFTRHLGLGLVLGVLTGLEARGFMRLLSEEPEFTWSGSALVVGIFAFVGVALALTHDLKIRGWSRWCQLLALPTVALGLGQGLLLMPGIAAMTAALSRRRWLRLLGVTLLLTHLTALTTLLGSTGRPLTPQFVVGLVALAVCCAAVAGGVRLALTGWGDDE